eukprot:scaffold73720_cov25-Tisochrysis_lutea.AAC.1
MHYRVSMHDVSALCASMHNVGKFTHPDTKKGCNRLPHAGFVTASHGAGRPAHVLWRRLMERAPQLMCCGAASWSRPPSTCELVIQILTVTRTAHRKRAADNPLADDVASPHGAGHPAHEHSEPLTGRQFHMGPEQARHCRRAHACGRCLPVVVPWNTSIVLESCRWARGDRSIAGAPMHVVRACLSQGLERKKKSLR